MAKLISMASIIIDEMKRDGKVNPISFQQSASIDHELATGLKRIKNDFEVKEKNSRAFVSKIELSSFSH